MNFFIIFSLKNKFQDVRTVKLTLKKNKTEKQVKWTEGTVDNENLNKKKSKCKFNIDIFTFERILLGNRTYIAHDIFITLKKKI